MFLTLDCYGVESENDVLLVVYVSGKLSVIKVWPLLSIVVHTFEEGLAEDTLKKDR